MFNKKKFDALKSDFENLMGAFGELEARVAALEDFNRQEGAEILEALQEQVKQERLFTSGMESIVNYGVKTGVAGK